MTSNSVNSFTLLYFAALQEYAGKSEEKRIVDNEMTTKTLFDEVCKELGLCEDAPPVRVSVNHEFVDWSYVIQPNDIVAFIPPVAGG